MCLARRRPSAFAFLVAVDILRPIFTRTLRSPEFTARLCLVELSLVPTLERHDELPAITAGLYTTDSTMCAPLVDSISVPNATAKTRLFARRTSVDRDDRGTTHSSLAFWTGAHPPGSLSSHFFSMATSWTRSYWSLQEDICPWNSRSRLDCAVADMFCVL
jgi:hypothetical protein